MTEQLIKGNHLNFDFEEAKNFFENPYQ